MNNIKVITMSMDDIPTQLTNTCLALGNFDGIHIGHQKLIKEAKKIAINKGTKCAMMTFSPHPKYVLANNEEYKHLITPWENKITILEALGVEQIFLVEFSKKFASVLPNDFVQKYINAANPLDIVIGDDFKYGYRGLGTPESLDEEGKKYGFNVTTIPSLMYGNDKISSSLIRQLLKIGNIIEITNLLGRYHQIRGKVVDGEKRGRLLGYPTANIELTDAYLLPENGVYAVKVSIDDETFFGVMNIGYKPTFNKDGSNLSVEIHILNYDKTIYGKHLIIDIVEFIRTEIKFTSKEALINQIEQDVKFANSLSYI